MTNNKEIIQTNGAPQAIGPYSQGVKVGQLLFTSGQLGMDPATGLFPETVEEQTKLSLNHVKAIVEASGGNMNQVVKSTVFLKDMNDFLVVNEIYSGYFAEPYPARSAVQVARLPKDALVEIEVIVQL
ncbi:RidA family protein [Paenibacillus macquariensis]|uniref:Endoribonuclease L-PSP n=1 Tax=Paenibacillus macquariensis TaxID=948756 RepID=A0ABY1K3C7_9BACL|nr:RidA family protein [Paenibacillus macquariensis]MEC0090365.1 RidA family protein [Paenibacillus macquariensis]OAB39718.1 reactive intermediate/imine deaminase [Paenibacillus macquariensis subsp. macquariensis]SIR20000.1 endoribonuclease L-PSP [Paenibacillus macquariensis]